MTNEFTAESYKVYDIQQYTMLNILEGSGRFMIDFKTYKCCKKKAIFLEKGQFVKFLGDQFKVRFITFSDTDILQSRDARVLFKHLVSMGYIDFKACKDREAFVTHNNCRESMDTLVRLAVQQWYWKNPFGATKEEYQVLFDINQFIETELKKRNNPKTVKAFFKQKETALHTLVKRKLGISISKMTANKHLLNCKRAVAFTDKNIQEIAYDHGYTDPAYFNKVFKKQVGQTPLEFRANFDYKNRDSFVQELMACISAFHKKEHRLHFYADKMCLSTKALSHKVRNKMNTSLGQLIRDALIASAKEELRSGESVKHTAADLGFIDPNHFSRFFKRYTGLAPSHYGK